MNKTIIHNTVLAILCSFVLSCKVNQNITKNETKEALIKAMNWQEANPIFAKAPTDWTNGAYYIGVVKAHEATGNKIFLKTLKSMAERNQWKPWERFFHADDIAITYSYLYLKSIGEESNIKPTAEILQDHLFKAHEWRSGTAKNEQKILWWWCDALFMAPPVITKYTKLNNDISYLKEMDTYYAQSYDLLYNKEEHLFARDTRYLWTGTENDIKEKNGKRIFWSRGNGWVLAGLALILADMPKDYANRFFYENLFKEMAHRIKDLQHEDGLWRTSLLSPASFNHGEVSGSGFFTYALSWGINNGLLNKTEYKPIVTKAWKAILQCQQENGKVGWVQNIGADPKPASADSWQNFGTGAFLMAGSEYLKL